VALISSHYFSRLYFYATATRRAGEVWERSNKAERSPLKEKVCLTSP